MIPYKAIWPKKVEQAEDMRYGQRLTEDEYDRKLSEIHQELASDASRVRPEDFAAREFDLLVDHKLGVDFPEEKRVSLREASMRIHEHQLRLTKRFRDGEFSPQEFAVEIGRAIPAMMAKEYSEILSPDELEQLLGIVDGQAPEMPIDPTMISPTQDIQEPGPEDTS
ncbi:MAG: hypothetical protein OEV49_16665 [candidate division Zixibacteria bacterium]|nr:hypothetical protein [candidate division Zixibacteria bacterium]MDH3938828.1 hypothetical protein [candidate division Zixibacteria bacterium]MDH4032404.1 hypothetical protein [candidate division Zixibacteria bacterium]